ncbi:5-methylcytosine-specific restriction protein A [Arthrobacter ginsengisoli]|uniref:5-methylcytosine-specific restriction protein A n=1 Tax=Arthrobacter ginsengisoli TaxID=1356565 RepID=A0ABU1U7L7_9MICC|nr:HNH endonuclease [Arthrobacter ginsengisoli]MDR7081179.1 5-methylcytosine-specific restriction protein A [Arthrobacter ginsengisoli]
MTNTSKVNPTAVRSCENGQMTAIILGWNPDRWNDWNYASVVDRVAASGLHVEPWSVGHRNISAGTDVWLLLQGGHGRGLIGHGVVVSRQPGAGPHSIATDEAAPDQTMPDETPTYVQLVFDALLPAGEQIAVAVLKDALPGIPWDSDDAPVLGVEPGEEAPIRALWHDFGPPPGPDPTRPGPGTYPQDAVTRVVVNRYEQDPDARRACIAHFGSSCAACGFSFEQKYGEIGIDFIPVHHIVPASQLGGSYELDPITDLIPLCANCHAMAHQGVGTPRTVAELRRIIGKAGFLRGSTVTDEQLEAQRQARELLGPQ